MGKLVQFEKRESGRDSGRADRGEAAEILIFTGVRYERGNVDAPPKPTASGTKRKRV